MAPWVTEAMPLAVLFVGVGFVVAALWMADRGQERVSASMKVSLDGMRVVISDQAVSAREQLRVHEEVVRSMSMMKGLHPHHADPQTFTPSQVARKDAEILEELVLKQETMQVAADRRSFEQDRLEWEAAEAASALAYRRAVEATGAPK